MRTWLRGMSVVVVAVTLVQHGARAAQSVQAFPSGSAEAGKAHWENRGELLCSFCHGVVGEGAFGPPLAGRKLRYERVLSYVRRSSGLMPSYDETSMTDAEIADIVAYFDTLPPAEKMGPWRIELPADAPRGQQVAVKELGCAQCHGLTFRGPRSGMAELDSSWESFKRAVYDHTNFDRDVMSQRDPALRPPERTRMGNYSPAQVNAVLLREMYDWALDLGPIVPLMGRIAAGPPEADGVTYTVEVINAGINNRGLTAEDITVGIELPENARVVRATGVGYEGTSAAKGAVVAVWRLPRLIAGARQTLTMTLGSSATTLRGALRWAKPAVKADETIVFALAPPGGRGRGGV